MRLQILLLTLACVCVGQADNSLNLIGIAINDTNPENPVAAPLQMLLTNAGCTVTISPPLFGSGSCVLKSLDKKSGRIEILSTGGIAWNGTIKGNLVSGFYKIEAGAQTGSFYLSIVNHDDMPAQPKPPPIPAPQLLRAPGGSCVPAIESSISGDIQGWNGETIFKLDNGQIWQQAVYSYTYFYAYHPGVTIYQGSGGCRMKVEGENETIKQTGSAHGSSVFGAQSPGPPMPLSTLRRAPRDAPRKTQGRNRVAAPFP